LLLLLQRMESDGTQNSNSYDDSQKFPMIHASIDLLPIFRAEMYMKNAECGVREEGA